MKTGILIARSGVIFVLLLAVGWGGISISHAQMIAEPARNAPQGKFELEGCFSLVKIEYDSPVHTKAYKVDRKLVGISVAYGLVEQLDLFIACGYIIEAENPSEIAGNGGDGFAVQGGLRGEIFQTDDFSLRAYGMLNYISEDYGKFTYSYPTYGRGSLKTRPMEVILALLATYDINQFRLYAGPEVVVYENSEYENAAGKTYDDWERKDIVSGKIGVQFSPDNWWLRGTLSFGSENGFTFGAGLSF